MNFRLERVTDPEVEPILLAEMKRHLRVYDDITSEDDDIDSLIVAAREWVEDYTGRALIDQQWRLTFGERVAIDPVQQHVCYCGVSRDSSTSIYLHRSPVLAIESFVSVDAAGVETAVDEANYQLREADSRWPRVVALNGASWATGQYRIVFRAGFANRDVSPVEGAEVVPKRFLQAMKLWTEANYDRDERLMPLLLDVAERLVRPERAEIGLA